MVKNGAEISKTTKDNSNMLIEAARQEQIGIVKYLIEQGVPANTKNNYGKTAYGYLVGKLLRDRDLLNSFLEVDVDLETKQNGETILFMAIERRDIELCKLLVSKGANINTTDRFNHRPSVRSSEMIKFLVNNGASMTAQDSRRNCFLCTAIETNNLQLAGFLLEKGADVDHLSSSRGSHLKTAIKEKNLLFVKFLVEHGAKIDITTNKKDIISYAKEEGNAEIVGYLEQMKVKEELKLKQEEKKKEEEAERLKQTLEKLNKAINEKQLAIAKNIIKENKNIELTSSQQKKLAILAVSNGELELLGFLVKEYNYKLNLPVNVNNQTLLIIAVISSRINSVNYLIAKGADASHKDYFNKMALDYVRGKELKKILKRLMKK